MKLKAIHLFIILLGALLLCSSLGVFMRTEGFENNDNENNENNENNDNDKLSHTKISPTQEFVNDLKATSKNKKHTDDNSDIYDYNSSKYKHNKKSSYIGPAGDTVITDSTHTDYPVKSYTHKKPKSTSLGIPYSQIPTGSEDLYILKSEVIPPVCPACPSISACPSKEPPPPCPPCARCPEPAFDCKKVPNYNNTDSRYLPVPVLSDFSQFGM